MPENFEDEEGDWVSLGQAVGPVMLRIFEMMAQRQEEALKRMEGDADE